MFGKRGASGGYCLGVVNKGIGCAIKIDDGSEVQYSVALKCLYWLNVPINREILDDSECKVLHSYENKVNYDLRNQKVGCLKVSSRLFS